MDITLDVEGATPVAQATDLANWLHHGRLSGVEKVKQNEAPPKAGEQGPELMSALTIVLSSSAVTVLVKSLFRYFEARRPKIKIVIKTGKNSITVECWNPPSEEELIKAISQLQP